MSIQNHHKSIEDNFKNWVLGIYWAYIVSMILSVVTGGIFAAVAVFVWIGSIFVAFNQRKSSQGTIYESHFQNYITVFYAGLASVFVPAVFGLAIVALISLATWSNMFDSEVIWSGIGVCGIILVVFVLFWSLWRIIKGVMQVKDGLPFGDTVVKLDRLKEIKRTKTQIEISGMSNVEGQTTQAGQAPVNPAPISPAPISPVAQTSSWEKEDQSNRVQTSEIGDNSTELESLHNDGILTDSEYEAAKTHTTIEKNPHLIELEILHKNGVLSKSSYEAARNRVLSNSENETKKNP